MLRKTSSSTTTPQQRQQKRAKTEQELQPQDLTDEEEAKCERVLNIAKSKLTAYAATLIQTQPTDPSYATALNERLNQLEHPWKHNLPPLSDEDLEKATYLTVTRMHSMNESSQKRTFTHVFRTIPVDLLCSTVKSTCFNPENG